MKSMDMIIKDHPFCEGLKKEYVDFIAGCASNVRFRAGEVIFKEDGPADKFYLIREGLVTIDMQATGHKHITIQTIGQNQILGWSWLIPPYKCRFTCRALEDTRAFAFDGKCLREKCEGNHDLGFELLKKLTRVFTERLGATRMQLLNLYER